MIYNSQKNGPMEISRMPLPHIRNALRKLEHTVGKTSYQWELVGAMKQQLQQVTTYKIGLRLLIGTREFILLASTAKKPAALIQLTDSISTKENSTVSYEELVNLLGNKDLGGPEVRIIPNGDNY